MQKAEESNTRANETTCREEISKLRLMLSKPYDMGIRLLPYVVLNVIAILGVRLWWCYLQTPGLFLDFDDLLKAGIENSVLINILTAITLLYVFCLLLYQVIFIRPRWYHLSIYIILAVSILVIPQWCPINSIIPHVSYPYLISSCLIINFVIETWVLWCNMKYPKQTNLLTQLGNGFVTKTTERFIETGWDNYINTIFNLVGQQQLEVESFSIGIAGTWGSGKTTFYDSVKRYLQESGQFVICEFKPWQILEPARIAPEFFAEFAKAINGEDDGKQLRKSIIKYARLLTEIPPVSGFAQTVENYLSSYQEDTISELRENVNTLLNKENTYVAVMIDDLDRLNKDELLEIMRLVRASANFKHVLFFLTYDKDYFASILDEKQGLEYLKKIVNVEINLPPIEQYKYGQLLIKSIGEIYNESQVKEKNEKRIAQIIRLSIQKLVNEEDTKAESSILYKYLCNFRDIKRFANQFGIVLHHLAREGVFINYYFRDLFWLEMLHYFAEKTYNDLQNNFTMLLEFNSKPNIRQRTLIVKKEELVKLEKLDKKSFDILKQLFDAEEVFKHTKSIGWVNNYYSYFAHRQLDNYVSSTEFHLLMNSSDPEQITKRIKTWLQQSYNLNNVKQILNDFPFKGEFEHEIEAQNYTYVLLSLLKKETQFDLTDFILALFKQKYQKRYFRKIPKFNPENIIRDIITKEPDKIWNIVLTNFCGTIRVPFAALNEDNTRPYELDSPYIVPMDMLQRLAKLNYTLFIKARPKKQPLYQLFNSTIDDTQFVLSLSYTSAKSTINEKDVLYTNLLGYNVFEPFNNIYIKKERMNETVDKIYNNLLTLSKVTDEVEEETIIKQISETIQKFAGSVKNFEIFIKKKKLQFTGESMRIFKGIGMSI